MVRKRKTAKQLHSTIGRQYTHMRFAVGYLTKSGKRADMNMGLVAMAQAIGADVSNKTDAKTALAAFFDSKYMEVMVQRPFNAQMAQAFFESKEWLDLRYKTLKRYGRLCMCCGDTSGVMQVDHIKPRSKYPELALDPENVQVLCKACNTGKSNKDETDWRPKT